MTQLNELKTELASLRVQKIAGGSASKLTKMCVALFPVVVGGGWCVKFGNGKEKGTDWLDWIERRGYDGNKDVYTLPASD